MGVSIERVIELALVKLIFAIADLDASGDAPELIAAAKENMFSVVEDLARVAPRFDLDTGSTTVKKRFRKKSTRARLAS